MNQNNSVFMPGLTRRGPVFNALGALPTLSPGMKFAVEAGLLAAGVFKKLPLPVAIGAALLVWKLLPDTSTANPPAGALTTPPPDTTIPAFDFSDISPPTVPQISSVAGYAPEY